MIKKKALIWNKAICSKCGAKFECRNSKCRANERTRKIFCWCEECSKPTTVRCEYKPQKEQVSFT